MTKSVLSIIPARGGSKGISKKNIIDIETLKKNIDEVIKENKIKFKEFGKRKQKTN